MIGKTKTDLSADIASYIYIAISFREYFVFV